MCDYSLEGLKKRDARVGDHLVLECLNQHGCKGFIALSEQNLAEPTVVCIPFGTTLRLYGVPPKLKTAWGVADDPIAYFDMRTPNAFDAHWLYRDGILVEGVEGHICLQNLPYDLQAKVVSIPAAPRRDTETRVRVLEDA